MKQNNHTSDVYAIVTNQIIAQLEKGVIPWRKPWADAGPPQNLLSKRLYKGINIWLLNGLSYDRNLFLTYNQLGEIGGKVKKGEKGHLVVFWKIIDKSEEENTEKNEEAKKTSLLRYYWVYNIAQCENIDGHIPNVSEQNIKPILSCESIVEGMPQPPQIIHKEPDAYYHPGKDYVNMPKKKTFISSEAYYATLFHELIHSTGHASRLNRKGVTEMTPFGSDIYSTEEIIAELGTCYLTSVSGIAPVTFENNAAYIQGWIEHLKDDQRVIVYASMQAQKSTDYVLNLKDENNNVEITEVQSINEETM
jgi:antirestriction protein ArdC